MFVLCLVATKLLICNRQKTFFFRKFHLINSFFSKVQLCTTLYKFIPDNKFINRQKSHIKYKMKFNFKCLSAFKIFNWARIHCFKYEKYWWWWYAVANYLRLSTAPCAFFVIPFFTSLFMIVFDWIQKECMFGVCIDNALWATLISQNAQCDCLCLVNFFYVNF